MTQDFIEGMEQPEGTSDREIVAAAHAMLSGSRQATRIDLLLSTVMEVLAEGELHLDELHTRVRRTWPAADISIDELRDTLDSSLSTGERLVRRDQGLTGELWTLDETGRGLVATTAAWQEAMRARLVAQIRERAAASFRAASPAEANLWSDRLSKAMFIGISNAESAYLGAVAAGPSTVLRPARIDQAALLASVTSGVSADVGEFLMGCALAAIDPTDPFGDELVTSLATACVLHGHLARLDVKVEAERLGALAGVEAVLDTPLLLQLIGGRVQREPLERMIRAATDGKVRVVVLQHYLDELAGLVTACATDVEAFEERLGTVAEKAAYIALADGEDVLVAYAELVVEGSVSNWEGFTRHVAALSSRLTAFGAEVRDHGNSDREQVAVCEGHLRAVLSEPPLPMRRRRPEAIAKDAETLCLAYRHRRRQRREAPQATWPATVVVTYDRRLARAYERIDAQSRWPLTMKPDEFTLLVARVRPVPELRELSEAAARMLTRDIADRVVMRYPPRVALDMAEHLAGDAAATDVRVAQLTNVHDALEAAGSEDILAAVMRHRHRRDQEAAAHAGRVTAQLLEERSDAAERAYRERDELEVRRQEAVALQERDKRAVEELRAQVDERPTDEQVRTRTRRATLRGVFAGLHACVAVIALLVGGGLAFTLFVVAGLLVWWQTEEWVADQHFRLRRAFVGVVADTAAVVVLLHDLLT